MTHDRATPLPGPLARLEKTFQSFLLGEDAFATLAPSIADGARLDKAALADIYASGYVARLEEVLGENFEGLHTLMGDEEFASLCRAYIREHPSRVRSVRWTGHRMSAFLSKTAPWSVTS